MDGFSAGHGVSDWFTKKLMRTLIVLPLILLLNMSHCFAFSKPHPQKAKVEMRTLARKLSVGGVAPIDVLEKGIQHDSIELKKVDKYTELLNQGLARKTQKNRNA